MVILEVSCTAGEPLKDASGTANLQCSGVGAGSCPATHACSSGVCCPNKRLPCHPTQTPNQLQPFAEYLCNLPVAVGAGALRIISYYYDASQRSCRQFS